MLRIVAVTLLLAALVAAQSKTTSARLSGGKPKHKVRRNYVLPAGRKAVEKPLARKGKVYKFDLYFFDVDGNGKFNDLHVDGWSLPRMPFMLPLEKTVIIGRSVVTWTVAAGGKSVDWARAPIPVEKWQEKTLVAFNTWRFMNGLPGVTVDKKLSDGCRKHCVYMDQNTMTHNEEQGKPGYTEEGALAGRRSCLSPYGPNLSILALYSSFYHRLPLIHPDTRAVGIGVSRQYTAVDGLSAREARSWRYPIVIPAPNSWYQPTLFAPEQPRPYPAEISNPGFPITLTFGTAAITGAEAELRLKNAKGPKVRFLLSSPEYPANKKRKDNRKSICLIPRTPLLPKKTYWVSVRWRRDGKAESLEWLFSTGRGGPNLMRR